MTRDARFADWENTPIPLVGLVLLDFSLTVKAAPHECLIRTSLLKAYVKAEKRRGLIQK